MTGDIKRKYEILIFSKHMYGLSLDEDKIFKKLLQF